MLSKHSSPQVPHLKIFVVGRESSGKSSLINGSLGVFASNTSRFMETFHIKKYCPTPNLSFDQIKELSDNLTSMLGDNQVLIDCLKSGESIIDTYNTEFLVPDTLGGYIMYDFPGILSPHDVNNLFFEKVKEYLPTADVILYTIDSTKNLDPREIAYFQEIKGIVKKLTANGKHIKLLIALNKFDIFQDTSLSKIQRDISESFGIDINDIFKVSSHKILISNIKKNCSSLYIPEVFRNGEIQHILKNANVNTTQSLATSIREKRVIHGQDISYSLNLLTDDKTSEDKLNTGDYDGLLDTLANIKRTFIEKETAITKTWMISIMDLVTDYETKEDIDKFISEHLGNMFDVLDKKHNEGRIINCYHELVEYLVDQIIDVEVDIVKSTLLQFIMQKNVFEYEDIIKNLFKILADLSSKGIFDEFQISLIETLLSKYTLDSDNTEALLNFFSKGVVWENKRIMSIVNNKSIKEINNNFCYCLILALVPRNDLKLLDRLGKIDYSRIRSVSQCITNNLLRSFDDMSESAEEGEPLLEALFSSNGSTFKDPATVLLLNYN